MHGKIAGYLTVSRQIARKGASAEQIKERNRIVQESKLDRDMIQLFLRTTRGAEAIFGPFKAFAALSESEFAERAPAVVARIASQGEERRRINSLVVAAFKDAQPTSLKDVAEIYATLFKSIEPQRKAYIDACARAFAEPVTGFDPDLIRLIESPLEILPASKCDSAGLRDFIQRLPQQAGRRNPFIFAKINELGIDAPRGARRAQCLSPMRRAPKILPSSSVARRKTAAIPCRDIFLRSFRRKENPFRLRKGAAGWNSPKAIASKSNPLTARVMVNRVWMHHFGEGFVPSVDDLGHPE
jgi:hypothetical protein